jgi:hypothetical protein
MLSSLAHNENATKNITEIPSQLSQNSYHQENKQQMLARM